MAGPDPQNFKCENCNAEIEESFDYCPECGAIFVSANCETHPEDEAKGVCIICSLPLCSKCGESVDNKFLCSDHSGYRIMQGMAGVYYEENITKLEYAKSILENEGLHPFIYSNEEKIWPGVQTPGLNPAHGSQNILMLPLNEVIRAEEIIEELEL
jgi:hypothetical protein